MTPFSRNLLAVVLFCLAGVTFAMMAVGCAAKPAPTDATQAAIQDTQAASNRAVEHLDKAIDLNQKMQRDLNALRQLRPAGVK